MSKRVLIIDDDLNLVAILREYLDKYNYQVFAEHTPTKGLRALQNNPVDIVILDVMLPEKDGVQVCKEIRRSNNVPILMLTARGDAADRIVGLEVGADDYLLKPFDP